MTLAPEIRLRPYEILSPKAPAASGGLPGARHAARALLQPGVSTILGISAASLSEHGKAYTYTHLRLLSELYLVEGWRCLAAC
jgi:hypothetical protein